MARPIHLDRLSGRPSRYNRAAVTEILGRMCQGEALYVICQDEHLPSDSTVRGWAESGKYPEFTRAFDRARRQQAHVWFEQAVTIADDSQAAETVPQLGSYQLRVRARQHAASRLAPDAYGERIIGPGAGGGAQIIITLPGKPDRPSDSARVIEGEARQVEPGTD